MSTKVFIVMRHSLVEGVIDDDTLSVHASEDGAWTAAAEDCALWLYVSTPGEDEADSLGGLDPYDLAIDALDDNEDGLGQVTTWSVTEQPVLS